MKSFRDWLYDRMRAEYSKSHDSWSEVEARMHIERLSTLELLDYYAWYQHEKVQ